MKKFAAILAFAALCWLYIAVFMHPRLTPEESFEEALGIPAAKTVTNLIVYKKWLGITGDSFLLIQFDCPDEVFAEILKVRDYSKDRFVYTREVFKQDPSSFWERLFGGYFTSGGVEWGVPKQLDEPRVYKYEGMPPPMLWSIKILRDETSGHVYVLKTEG